MTKDEILIVLENVLLAIDSNKLHDSMHQYLNDEEMGYMVDAHNSLTEVCSKLYDQCLEEKKENKNGK